MSAERLPLGKKCTRCGEWKLYEQFGDDKRKRDLHQSACKSCDRDQKLRAYKKNPEKYVKRSRCNREINPESARQYYWKNRNKSLAQGRLWRQKNCEKQKAYRAEHYQQNRKQSLEASRRWFARHPDYRRKWYEANRDKALERNRKWYEANRETARAASHRRRARKLAAEGGFTAREFMRLCEMYGNICLCCGEEKSLTADHVIPLSKGGSNNISNIQPLCKLCNLRKYTKTTDYRPLFDKEIEELGEVS